MTGGGREGEDHRVLDLREAPRMRAPAMACRGLARRRAFAPVLAACTKPKPSFCPLPLKLNPATVNMDFDRVVLVDSGNSCSTWSSTLRRARSGRTGGRLHQRRTGSPGPRPAGTPSAGGRTARAISDGQRQKTSRYAAGASMMCATMP